MKNISNLIFVLLATGLFYMFTSPEYEKVKLLQVSAAEYANVIENVEKIAQSRDGLREEYDAIPLVERDRLMKVLPDNVDGVRLALDLDTMASRYNIVLSTVKVDKADPNSALAVLPDPSLPYEAATVSLNFKANYDGFSRFLEDLEKSLRIMDVKSVSFHAFEDGTYDHSMRIETYWLK